MSLRPSQRSADELRSISLTRHYTEHAEGSVLVAYGKTKVLCTASVNPGIVPRFMKGRNKGWVTAEYGMLPRATNSRNDREAARGHQSGRTQEIQRLIGRSLRACVDLKKLGEHSITLDCDVLQADGGTRTASITGACVALFDAISYLMDKKIISENPFRQFIAAVSVGMYRGTPVLDLDYKEDSQADTDMNAVVAEDGNFIEVQGTAEGSSFSPEELNAMLVLARKGAMDLMSEQKRALEL